MNDSLAKNVLQDIKQLQFKVDSIEHEIFKKKKPDFGKEIKTEILNILKNEPELMGWNLAYTKRLEDKILKLENELRDMMTLVLELCDSFTKGSSESVSQCESKQLHKLVKLELDTLTKEVLDSNKQALKSFNNGQIKQMRAELNTERKKNNEIESRLKILENKSTKSKDTESNNANTKDGIAANLKTKEVKFQTENQKLGKGIKLDDKISHDEKKLTSTKGPSSNVTNTKKKAAKSSTGSKKDTVISENKATEASKNKNNDLKKDKIYLLSESG